MTRKPNGANRRSLTKRGGVIYYQRVVNGKRVRFSWCNRTESLGNRGGWLVGATGLEPVTSWV